LVRFHNVAVAARRAFVKATVAGWLVCSLLLAIRFLGDESGPDTFGEVIVALGAAIAYGLVAALWLGSLAALGTILWRAFGARLLVVLGGAAAGGLAGVAAVFVAADRMDLKAGGLHGGGQAAALVLLALAGAAAVAGAIIGALVALAFAVAFVKRNARK
jgi:hypothetical protein